MNLYKILNSNQKFWSNNYIYYNMPKSQKKEMLKKKKVKMKIKKNKKWKKEKRI